MIYKAYESELNITMIKNVLQINIKFLKVQNTSQIFFYRNRVGEFTIYIAM